MNVISFLSLLARSLTPRLRMLVVAMRLHAQVKEAVSGSLRLGLHDRNHDEPLPLPGGAGLLNARVFVPAKVLKCCAWLDPYEGSSGGTRSQP